ncbi:MAG: tRNA 2-thiouridine(34) synthase MnmA [Flavobacteriaceae bacterium]|jgi:tRNA-specific 2-thiouridylase|nr:tRNA 2-thiouridine(34) synthase MnmA [Flavobacteriaceae bacterium]
MKKVVIALSGGVDSSVSAYLLKKQGYHVIGLFMKNWHDESLTISNECPWLDDSNDAMIVSQNLKIPFQTVDLSKEYNTRIIQYMFREYKHGRTPNPDILCNREIKFDIFMKIALDLGADFVATGHYSRISREKKGKTIIHKLISGVDKSKDQSYFLCQLNQKQLSKILFPIGNLKKTEVRKIANDIGLVNAEKKDSQGLCFVGKVKLPDFLMQKLKPKEGLIIEIDSSSDLYKKKENNSLIIKEKLIKGIRNINYKIDDGREVGKHNGAFYFTIGQRKGLRVGGTNKPLFVLQTDVENNIVYVGMGKDHPGLYRDALLVDSNEEHWIREDLKLSYEQSMIVMARIRYRQPLQKAILFRYKEGIYVLFDKPQSSITKGQFVAWYIEDELIGSGVIS